MNEAVPFIYVQYYFGIYGIVVYKRRTVESKVLVVA